MFEIVFNAIKFVLSDEARKGAASLLELIRKSSEWTNDICTIKARVSRETPEHFRFLGDLLSLKMEALGYNLSSIERFKTTLIELANNAVEHGTKKRECVKLVFEINNTYISTTVFNTELIKMDLHVALKSAHDKLDVDPRSKRGRGILLCYDLSDELKIVEKNMAFKSVIYKESVCVATEIFPEFCLAIVAINAGHRNPALRSHLLRLIKEISFGLDLIIYSWASFSPNETTIIRTFIEIAEIFERRRRKASAVIPRFLPIIEFDDEVITHSWKDALTLLGRPEVLKIVNELSQRFPTEIPSSGW